MQPQSATGYGNPPLGMGMDIDRIKIRSVYRERRGEEREGWRERDGEGGMEWREMKRDEEGGMEGERWRGRDGVERDEER